MEEQKVEKASNSGSIESLIIAAIDAGVPPDLFGTAKPKPRRSREGRRFKVSDARRGRYVRATTRRDRDAKIAIDATLRAAAPYQRARRVLDILKEVPMDSRLRHLKIEPCDLRYKEFKHRSGVLFIFAVDASGSMALNRMAYAKGALTRLLQQAYVHRDKVALISFRGSGSNVLLAPTRSVELARTLVDAIPAGGGTPLSAGIVKAIEVARLARLRESSQAMLLLFTDGRANVALAQQTPAIAPTIAEELKQLGAMLRTEEIQAVVVDTRTRFVANGEAERVANIIGAHYVYLPRANAAAVYETISSITHRPSEK